MNQGSSEKSCAVLNFAPTFTKFCDMSEGQTLTHDTKFVTVDTNMIERSMILTWSLSDEVSWYNFIKAG